MNTFDLRLDLDKGLTPGQVVRIRQGDHDGTTINAAVYDHGTALSGTVTACAIVMKLPDGTHYYRKGATWADGTATVTIDERQAASVVGRTLLAYFTVTVGTAQYSTGAFAVVVEPDAVGDAELPEGYDTAIQDAIDALTEATDSIPEQVQSEVDAQLVAHPEWTTTVQDNSLTDAKLVQRGGILQREQWLETMLPNIPRKATAEADVHSVTDSAGGGPLGIEVYGRSMQDGTPTPDAPVAIQSVEAANLLDVTATSQTIRGVAYTVDGGVVTASGTASGGNATLTLGTMSLSAGTYALSGITGGSGTTYALRVYKVSGNATIKYVYNADTFELDADAEVGVQAYVYNGATVSGLTLTPMLVHGSVPMPYVPYGCVGLWAQRTSDTSQSVTIPIDLGGHALRSLPDGTRDEVNVDEWGHAVLVQRVGHAIYDGTQAIRWFVSNSANTLRRVAFDMAGTVTTGISSFVGNVRADKFKVVSNGAAQDLSTGAWLLNVRANGTEQVVFNVPYATFGSQDEALAWFAANPVEVDYQLATPVTIDLGHLDPALLPAPDLTAYVVPSAPSVLRYGFDVAAAIAEIATS